jgi:hypothetical protein
MHADHLECELVQLPSGRWHCPVCDAEQVRTLPVRAHRICAIAKPFAAGGPGTELKRLIKKWLRIDPAACSTCGQRAAEMDRRGPAWCCENLDRIVGWLEEAARDRKLPFVKSFAKLLILKAIRTAKRKAGELHSADLGESADGS